MSGRRKVDGRGAVVRQALSNPDLRRVLAAYLLFNVAEWATYIGLLVWGFGVGGVRGSSAIALVQLVPAALLAAPAAALLGRLPRGPRPRRGLRRADHRLPGRRRGAGDRRAGRRRGHHGGRLLRHRDADPPPHNALLPEVSRTTGDLTAGNAASGSLEALRRSWDR